MLLSLLWVPRVAQAIPPSLEGARLTVALGPSIGLGADPLVPLGSSIAVEAMWIVPGGSAYDFELGVRGEIIEQSAQPNGHELTMTGGASVALSRRPLVLGLAPLATGGLRLGVARDSGSGPALVIGPHLALSVERSLFEGVGLRLGVGVHATLTDPLRLTPAISLSLSASRTMD